MLVLKSQIIKVISLERNNKKVIQVF
jgi:hypothetical protein